MKISVAKKITLELIKLIPAKSAQLFKNKPTDNKSYVGTTIDFSGCIENRFIPNSDSFNINDNDPLFIVSFSTNPPQGDNHKIDEDKSNDTDHISNEQLITFSITSKFKSSYRGHFLYDFYSELKETNSGKVIPSVDGYNVFLEHLNSENISIKELFFGGSIFKPKSLGFLAGLAPSLSHQFYIYSSDEQASGYEIQELIPTNKLKPAYREFITKLQNVQLILE